MANGICDICNTRPASLRAQIVENGLRRTVELCDVDYRRLAARQQQSSSPLESLFGRRGSLFDDFIGDGLFQTHRGAGTERSAGEADTMQAGQRHGGALTERLSSQAEKLLQDAARTATEFGRREVDTEHLLLALTGSEVVTTILDQFKVSAADLRQQLEDAAPRGKAEDVSETTQIGVAPRVKDAMARALQASSDLGHSYVGPEHLLIGLAEEGEGMAADILRRYGLSSQAIRQKVTKVVGRGAEGGRVDAPSNTPNLDKYSRDLTKLAAENKLDPVFGRAREIETTIEVLARRKKNNPVLIGDPGVGKTAIVEGLAQRILAGEVPEALADKRLVELNVNALVAGAKYRGEFEERLQEILKEILEQKESLVLFIDEIHSIVGAGQGGGEGGLDIANVFKPALARGELNLIGATTLNEYQKYIEKDAALERRFQPVYVEEPTIAQTIMILRGLRDMFEAHHKVTISDEAIIAATELSDRYVTARFLPDKAIDLIDQASARVKLAKSARPVEAQEMDAEVRQLKREQDYAAARKHFDEAAEIGARLTEKEADLKKATEEWKRAQASGSSEVRAADVAQVVSKLTGIPVTELTVEEKEKLLHMEDRLHRRVVGQNEAIAAVSDAIRLARAGLREGDRPIANFLFLGPTGVGKTELAKALAEVVFGDEDAMIRIDMSEYGQRHTVARLIGAPPGYVGYDEGGQLTEKVRRRPHSVILLDEIEKAHGDVYNILLQVFDDGRLTDGKGRVVDFKNTVIIATSNLGSDVIQRDLAIRGTEKADAQKLKADLMGVLRNHFRPEFINRIDEVIVFHALDRSEIRQIVEMQLARVAATAAGQGVTLIPDASLIDHLSDEGYAPEFGARELRRLIRSELETVLAREMLSGAVEDGDEVRALWDDDADKVRLEKSGAAPHPAPPEEEADAEVEADSEAMAK